MIDGIWWLVILIAIIVILWLVAKSRGAKAGEKHGSAKSKNTVPNDALQKTSALLKQYFPDYRVTRKAKHLLIYKHNKKVAMITIDKKIAEGKRRLGEVPVINYHRVPSRAQLATHLQEAE
ncbi:hypothetical protein AOT82_1277 [Psychrobacter sp. AntiMn-1]|uniref:hypothetical protein n=1 Tax=Psychrobacter sp. AntiMn-1 TaxID=1720344 RepID=UPI0008A6A4D9|nr:hypothetical protein [Psychrobacter sp. AntiMn-1]AOY43656.1 hypothetical protein AOT82_1277 [Psychrobacter sp. AntiMn-1]